MIFPLSIVEKDSKASESKNKVDGGDSAGEEVYHFIRDQQVRVFLWGGGLTVSGTGVLKFVVVEHSVRNHNFRFTDIALCLLLENGLGA